MTVKSIVKLVASLLNRKDILSYLNDGTLNNDSVTEEVNTLVDCYNIVAEELSTIYPKIIQSQKLTITDGVLKYTQFIYSPVKILSVKDMDGNDVDCTILPTEIRANASRVSIEYTYIPVKRKLDENSDFKSTPIKERVIAYGVATEFCLIKGSYEEASTWHDKYVNAVKNSLAIKNVNKIKGRVWW